MKSEEHRRVEQYWTLDSATELENPRLVTLSPNMSHDRMEDFTETTPLDIEPMYFFDQMKPKRRKWEKKDCLPHLKHTSEDKLSLPESIHPIELDKEARQPIEAAPKKKYAFQSFAISPTPVASNIPIDVKFSKIRRQKSPFEEFKQTAAELLYELGETLQTYAENNIAFPVGIVNLVNYSWLDLIEGAYKYATKKSLSKKQNVLQSNSSTMMVDKINYPRIECYKENYLMKAKKDRHHFVPIEKTCWIAHYPYSKLEILKWKKVLDIAVKKLQEAIIQIKTEEAKLKEEGFNKQLILRHYNDPKDEAVVDNSPFGSQYFWLELLKGRPQMPAVQKDDPEMKKFHYALIDGSSMIYYPSGRVAVCQSYSALPWGGMYTNIFSDLPDQVILGTFTPFGCGSISFPKGQIISMMFNEDGGLVISRNGHIVREWAWPTKGKLDDPIEILVNAFITVKISGRFAISLFYKWHPESLKLSLAPIKCKSSKGTPHSPETPFPDVNPISKEAKELLKAYKMKCKLLKCITRVRYPSNLSGSADPATFDTIMDISPMFDIATVIKLRRLERKAKDILFNWLDYYRFSLGLDCLHMYKVPKFPPKVVRKQAVSRAEFLLKPSAKGKDENKEYLLYRNTYLKLKGVLQPSPLSCIQKTPASKQSVRLPFPIESKVGQFASHLACPVVLRNMLCGKEGFICRCSTYSIPEVTDLEYDHLINEQLSSMDQIIIVYVFSAKEEDKTLKEVNKVYREQNKTRSMPCIQSRLDSFRFLKYNIISASKFTGSNYPLLVQRHNVIPGMFLIWELSLYAGDTYVSNTSPDFSPEPGAHRPKCLLVIGGMPTPSYFALSLSLINQVFVPAFDGDPSFSTRQEFTKKINIGDPKGREYLLRFIPFHITNSLDSGNSPEMYIQGKLLFANFIFNGYSTSAKDLHKQIEKTRGDYEMGYFLPSDFRIRDQPTSCFGNSDILL